MLVPGDHAQVSADHDASEHLLLARDRRVFRRLRRRPCCASPLAMDDKEIDTAKMQVQGQLAAQYIQDVMQARPTTPDH